MSAEKGYTTYQDFYDKKIKMDDQGKIIKMECDVCGDLIGWEDRRHFFLPEWRRSIFYCNINLACKTVAYLRYKSYDNKKR